MPFYVHCIRCNKDGSYSTINDSCPKCDGTGNDWRDDRELEEGIFKDSGLHLKELITNRALISADGKKFFYEDRIPSVAEEKEELTRRFSKDEATTFIEDRGHVPQDYDYYIEPCQLCISRNGATYDKCGWCHDSDTFYKERDEYAGNYIKLPADGWGYPFHETPHTTRMYYKDDKLIMGSNGTIPTEVTLSDVLTSKDKFNSVEKILGMKDAIVHRPLIINPDHSQILIDQLALLDQQSFSSPTLLDASGKIEFRFLSYQILSSGLEVDKAMDTIRDSLHSESNNFVDLLSSNSSYKNLCEVVTHEAFHILQALYTSSTGLMFDAQRRVAILKWMLLGDYFLDRNGRVPFDTDPYELLNHLDENSELYSTISRTFDHVRGDVSFIENYTSTSSIFDLNMYDIIEGSAFAFQKLIIDKEYNLDDALDEDSLPDVYKNIVPQEIRATFQKILFRFS